MQVIYQNEVKREHSGGTSAVGVNICVRRISGCVEGECNGGTRRRGSGI